MKIQTAIDRLERDIHQLKVDFERFFNGALTIPPMEFRRAVQSQIRSLRAAPTPALVHRFRLNTLEARFNVLNELFNRRVRDREEGLTPSPVASHPTRDRFDPYIGIVVNDDAPPEAVRALYAELYSEDDRGKTDLQKFQLFLLGQVAKIRERSGCSDVKFRIAKEGGKLKLKARPVQPTRQPATGGS